MSKAAVVAKSNPDARAPNADAPERTERDLGRAVALGLPVVSVAGALVVGFVSSIGPAILILAAGALLGTIALFWASVRTLSGDAPLPEDLESLAARRHSVNAVGERKQTVLRALKDLEHEHFIGKIDDADYAQISSEYRDQAKGLMREMDADVEPLRARAEELARVYLKKHGVPRDATATPATPEEESTAEPSGPVLETSSTSRRLECEACSTSNEHDATFCKKCGASLASATREETDASA